MMFRYQDNFPNSLRAMGSAVQGKSESSVRNLERIEKTTKEEKKEEYNYTKANMRTKQKKNPVERSRGERKEV